MRPVCLTRELFHSRIETRLLTRRVILISECWEWTHYRNEKGYGIIRIGGKNGWTERVHRVAFALWNGPLDEGVIVLH